MPPLPFPPLMLGPLGMQEMLIIMVVALIVFGPRKLPQIGKTLGKSLAEFRRTSTELRNTLEREVEMEDFRSARDQVSGLGRDLREGLDPTGGTRPPGSSPSNSKKSRGPAPTDSSAGVSPAEEAPAGGSAPGDARNGVSPSGESAPETGTAPPTATAADNSAAGGDDPAAEDPAPDEADGGGAEASEAPASDRETDRAGDGESEGGAPPETAGR